MQYLSNIDHNNSFAELYLKVRAKEKRLMEDEVVARLPYISKAMSANYKEWEARANSFDRIKKYFRPVNTPKSLLDIGCGNGWAAAGLAENKLLNVAAVDVNIEELEQAERVFKKPNLAFCYGNIFEDIFPAASFDYIVLNSSAQYFSDLRMLIDRLFYFLREGGEIHIIDTPFYKEEELPAARERTRRYYTSIDCPEMADHYFHHKISDLSPFNYQLMSDGGMLGKIRSLITTHVPGNFAWIIARK